MLLPRKVGPFTLMRKLDADGMTESFVAILDAPAGKQVVARLLSPVVTRDAARMAQIRARVTDLRGAVHPALAGVLDLVETDDGEVFVLEDQVDGAELRRVLEHCQRTGQLLPHNVYLNLAAQLCNALEALHARPGIESGSENVLHMALSPSSVWITADGKVTLCRYGLLRSPTALATQLTGALPARSEYLAPEQTHQDQRLTPATDLFALGSVLYELLTLHPMFRADTPLQTIHRVRRAEVTTQLLEVKEILPGLDKVLFRALSLNPRHRYQRAFVLREDLRGLMAGYSFADIDQATRDCLEPLLAGLPPEGDASFDGPAAFAPPPPASAERTQDLLDAVPDRVHDLSESPLEAPRVERLTLPDEEPGGFPDDTDALLGGFTDPQPIAGTGRTSGDVENEDHEGLDTSRTPLEAVETGDAHRLLEDTHFDVPRGDTIPMGIDGPTHPSMVTGDPDPRSSDVREPAPPPPPGPAPAPAKPPEPEPTIPPGAQSKTARMPNPLAGRLAPPETLHAPGKAPSEDAPPAVAPIGPDREPVATSPRRAPEAPRGPNTAAWAFAFAAVVAVAFVIGVGLCLGGGGLLSIITMIPDPPVPTTVPTSSERVSRAIVSLDPGNLEIVTDREGTYFVDYLRDEDGRRVRLRKKVDYVLEVFEPGFHVYTAPLSYRRGALVVEPITMIEETIEVADFPENIDPALYSRPTQSAGATCEGQ